MDEENKQIKYDEIDLMDYVKVIIKRKWLILVIFLVAVIAAGIFSFILPRVYKVDTAIEIGITRIQAEGLILPIEEPIQVVEKIKGDVHGVLVREKLGISEKVYPKIKAENPKDTRLIKIIIESSAPEEAENILEEINNLILSEHQEKLEKKKAEIEESIKEIQEELTLLETKKQYSEGIAELQIEISNLKNRIKRCELTKIVKSPTISKNPIRPKPVLNVAIAGVLGLFIGVFVAFGKEWWEKSNLLTK